MTMRTLNTRTLAADVASVLGARGPRSIDIGDGEIAVWQAEGEDNQPVVVQYHESRDAIRINHGPHTGLWFDPHAGGDDISYYGWPSEPIRQAATTIYATLHEGDTSGMRGPEHHSYDHEPNALDFALLDVIKQYMAEHKRAPTIREMADRMGVASTTSVTFRLKRLVRFGIIERGPYKSSRTMRIADEWKD